MTIKDWIQTYARELEGSDAERELEAIVGAARADDIKDFALAFEEYDPIFDAAEFDKFTAKGEKAWKDIDATEWVERQRGHKND